MRLKKGDKMASMDIIPSAIYKDLKESIEDKSKEGDKMASMNTIPDVVHKDMKQSTKDEDLTQSTEDPGSQGRDLRPPWLLFVSESGHGKRVPLSNFREYKFNRVGLKGYKLLPDGRLAAVFVVGFSLAEDGESDEQLVLVSQSGTINRIKVRDISIQSRGARGVILMRLEHAGKIQSASLISAMVDEAEGED